MPKSQRSEQHAGIKHVEERVIFSGVCELREEEQGLAFHIYSNFEDAVMAGVPLQKAAAVFGGLGQKPGNCRNFKLGRTMNCFPVGCTGTCHVFSLPRGPVPKGAEPRDEGKGPIVMLPGRFYWCSCT